MSVISRRPAFHTLAEARGWIAALGLRPAPCLPHALALAEDLVVTAPLPEVAAARRAGWAVPAEATLGASPYGPVPLAGIRRVVAGEAMPPGTDAVLAPDQASEAGRWVEVTGSVAPGDGVVAAGGHLASGQVLARAAEAPSLLARLLACRSAASMQALLAVATVEGITLGPIAAPAIGGLGVRPIEETVLGAGPDGAPAIALPADPAALLLTWCALLAPDGPSAEARLTRKLPSAVGLSDLVLVRLADGRATPLTAADQPSLAAFTLAAGWVEVPPGSEGQADGAVVTVRLFPPLLAG